MANSFKLENRLLSDRNHRTHHSIITNVQAYMANSSTQETDHITSTVNEDCIPKSISSSHLQSITLHDGRAILDIQIK